jgi:hypothetical protein
MFIRKLQKPSTGLFADTTGEDGAIPMRPVEARPAESDADRTKVEKLLLAGQPRQALDLLARSKLRSPWASNATAVCLLRLGDASRAVEIYRSLVLNGSLFLRPDVPTAWKVNFATALFLTDNLAGCVRLLEEIREEGHPGVQRLRAAVREWQARQSLWETIRRFFGGQPARRAELGFLPGEL